MSSITEYKTYLWDYLKQHHNVSNPKKFFHCLNPNHTDNNPSMMFTDKYNICKCFACGVSYDIFDLIGLDYNLSSFRDQIKKAEELYLDYAPIKREVKNVVDNSNKDYTKYFNVCFYNRDKTDYLEKRGITKELINKYKIGYDDKRNLVIFPINKHCYFGRSTVNNDKFKSGGNSDIWNEEYINENISILYITESIIDALSLEVIDSDIKVVSINGITNTKSLISRIKENNFNGIVGIIFDNDKWGINASKELKEELAKINVNSFSTSLVANFADEKNIKDLNQALVVDKDKLKSNYEYLKNILISNNKSKEKEGDSFEY